MAKMSATLLICFTILLLLCIVSYKFKIFTLKLNQYVHTSFLLSHTSAVDDEAAIVLNMWHVIVPGIVWPPTPRCQFQLV